MSIIWRNKKCVQIFGSNYLSEEETWRINAYKARKQPMNGVNSPELTRVVSNG
jgi:hypothetical protein